MTALAKRFDVIVNCAILLTCAAVVTVLFERHDARAASPNPAASIHQFKLGEPADKFPGVDYKLSRRTLVLYVKSTCPYCTDSMEFYRRLRESMGHDNVARLIAVSTEPSDVLNKYLEVNQLRVDAAISSQLHPQATPTLLLVDATGMVRRVWRGQQDSTGEREILASIAGS